MSNISKLKLSSQKRERVIATAEERVRSKVCVRLNEQLKISKADIAGVAYLKLRTAYFTDKQTCQRVAREIPARFRRWFWDNSKGEWLFELRYGNKAVEIEKDKPTIEVGALKNVPKTIETIVAAVEAGELDDVLLKAKDERRAAFKSKR